MTDSNDVLTMLVGRAGQLYSLPRVAMEVLELTNCPKVDVRRLKDCIENDPALTSKLLRVVNSSIFGLNREVSDLNQALAMLGIKPLKLLVLGFSLPDAMFTGLAGDLLQRFWQHTLTRAVAAREISRSFCDRPGDEAFLVGLLRDVGQLVLVQELGQTYVDFWRAVAENGGSLAALERHSLGFDHTELTAGLLDRWQLPPVLVEAIGAAGEASSTPRDKSRQLKRIVNLADQIAGILVGRRLELLPEVLDAAQTNFGLGKADLSALISTLQEKVAGLADVFSLKLPEGTDYAEVLSQAHAQLSQVAADAASELLRCRTSTADSPQVRALGRAVQRLTGRSGRKQETEGTKQEAGDTEQESEGSLLGCLRSAVASCRNAREPLSLLEIELEGYADMVFACGAEHAETILAAARRACEAVDFDDARCVQTHEARFALLLPGCDRRQAVRLGDELLPAIRQRISRHGPDAAGLLSLNAGAATIALPPKNFPPSKLLEAAARCLYAAQSSGGDSLKSIEIL